MAGIYDKVPVKRLHRTKFNLSNRVCTTGDFGPVYMTMCEEVIPGDVWQIGHEQNLKMNPMISPLLTEVNLDSHDIFVPMRLMYERWHEFISGGKDGDYKKPLKSFQDLMHIYDGTNSQGMHDKADSVIHDLYMYMKQYGPENFVHFYRTRTIPSLKDSFTPDNEIKAFFSSYHYDITLNPEYVKLMDKYFGTFEKFKENFYLKISNRERTLLAWLLAFSLGSVTDLSGYPCIERQLHDFIHFGFNLEMEEGLLLEYSGTSDMHNNSEVSANTQVVINGISIPLADFVSSVRSQYWLATPILAYWYCYNEWFRHPEFDIPYYCKWLRNGTLGVSDDEYDEATEEAYIGFIPFNRTWRKDYFTSCLPSAQRGTAPALPLSGILGIGLVDSKSVDGYTSNLKYTSGTNSGNNVTVQSNPDSSIAVDLSNAITFDINDLRLANALQRFEELNNVAGNRYTGFLKVQYGTSPADEILQRPDYFGRTRESIKFGDVLSTDSAGGSAPLGTRAGVGSSYGISAVRPYNPREHGVICEFVSAIPKPMYAGQGIKRSLKRKNKEDYYNSLFAGLGEQEVLVDELYFDPVYTSKNDGKIEDRVLGFIGRFDEYRTATSANHGLMRNSRYNSYSLDRFFNGVPSLNSEFVHVYVDKKMFLAVPSEPTFILYWGHLINCYRPMPEFAVPSLSD